MLSAKEVGATSGHVDSHVEMISQITGRKMNALQVATETLTNDRKLFALNSFINIKNHLQSFDFELN